MIVRNYIFNVLILALLTALHKRVSLNRFVAALAMSDVTCSRLRPVDGLTRIFTHHCTSVLHFRRFVRRPIKGSTIGLVSRPRDLPHCRFANGIRFSRIDFNCSSRGPMLRGVSLLVRPYRAITLIKHSNSNGSALIGLLFHCFSPGDKQVLVSKSSVQQLSIANCHRQLTVIRRRMSIFGNALLSGLACNGPRTAVTRIGRTYHVTHISRFVRHLPRNCCAVINRHKIQLSNNRQRQLNVTHTLLIGPSILIFSRTASDLSCRSRHSVRLTVQSVLNAHAAVVVTRHLDAIQRTSGVIILRTNHVTRINARSRLLTRNNVCRHLRILRRAKRLLT